MPTTTTPPDDLICEWHEEPDPTAQLRNLDKRRAAVLCDSCDVPDVVRQLLEDS